MDVSFGSDTAAQPVAVATPKVSHGKLASRKVFIGLPIYGTINPHFFLCLLKAAQDIAVAGLHGMVRPHLGDSAVSRARNSLTREFLESDCTHLLFIDSDLVFSTDQIRRIMMHDEPIVAGLYCKKQEGPAQYVINGCLEGGEHKENGLMEVRYAGTGFIRVAREVFDRMAEKLGDELRYQPDHNPQLTEYDFWKMGVYKYADGTRRWLSEDWYFGQMAMDIGYKVWVDRAILLKHSGEALYPLSYQEAQVYGRNFNSITPPESETIVVERG